MESVWVTTPPCFCARASASADLPLAVGPAISTALLSSCEFTKMSLVATLICNPANPALDSTVVDGARAILPSAGPARWLFDEVAVDIPFVPEGDVPALETRPRQTPRHPPSSIVLQPEAARRKNRFPPGHGSPT